MTEENRSSNRRAESISMVPIDRINAIPVYTSSNTRVGNGSVSYSQASAAYSPVGGYPSYPAYPTYAVVDYSSHPPPSYQAGAVVDLGDLSK